MGRTFSVEDFLKQHGLRLRKGKNLDADLQQLQKALKKEYGENYLIKTRGEGGLDPNAASSGVFPTASTDLSASHAAWQKMRPEFVGALGAKGALPSDVVKQFRQRPGFEGRVVEEMLNRNAIFQEKLPLKQFSPRVMKKMEARGLAPSEEYRVHVVGGRAVPSLAMPRFFSSPWDTLPRLVRARRAAKWTQKNVLDKLPAKQRNMSYGMDVAPLKGGGYGVIEMNPGGGSGLLDYPLIGNPLLHRAVTGRHTPAFAAAMGLGTAGVGAGLTHALTRGPSSAPSSAGSDQTNTG